MSVLLCILTHLASTFMRNQGLPKLWKTVNNTENVDDIDLVKGAVSFLFDYNLQVHALLSKLDVNCV